MIELISEEKIRSYDYLKIRCEFYDIWNRLFLNKNWIDRVIFRKYVRFWPLVKGMSRTRLGRLQFIPKFAGSLLNSELILRSNQLWLPRCWEYPWAILNSHLKPDSKILDIGSGHALFPLYLAQRSSHVVSIDINEWQMKILAPALAYILRVKVDYSIDDVLNLSAKDDTYDYVFCISVLEHLEEEVENSVIINKHANRLDRIAVRELLRVVKPGGRVILTLDYGNEDTYPRSFHFDYVKDLIEEFSSYLLEPPDNLERIRFSREKEEEMKRLIPEFFPYDPGTPPGGVLGIILTKR